MRIEFVEEGSLGCPLILMYGSDPKEFKELALRFQELARGDLLTCRLHALPLVQREPECEVTLKVGNHDVDVRLAGAASAFEWVLSKEGWAAAAELLAPFETHCPTHAHQWLAGPESGMDAGEVSVVVSNSGKW